MRAGGDGDEEVVLRIMDQSVEQLMVANDALDIAEDEERGVVDDKVSLTKGKQDYEERVPRLLAYYKIHQGVKILEPEDNPVGHADEWIYCVCRWVSS